jgi:hypothetical protein
MRAVLAKLEAHAVASGETLDVLYENAVEDAVFAEFPSFVKLWSAGMPISAADKVAGTVYNERDPCNLYRRE